LVPPCSLPTLTLPSPVRGRGFFRHRGRGRSGGGGRLPGGWRRGNAERSPPARAGGGGGVGPGGGGRGRGPRSSGRAGGPRPGRRSRVTQSPIQNRAAGSLPSRTV